MPRDGARRPRAREGRHSEGRLDPAMDSESLFDPPELDSERLILTPVEPRDAPAARELFVDDPEVTQFVAWKPLVTEPGSRMFVEREARAWTENEPCRATDERITMIGIHRLDLVGNSVDSSGSASPKVCRTLTGRSTETRRRVRRGAG